MQLPDKFHPGWEKLIRGKVKAKFSFFALQVLLGRLGTKVKHYPDSLESAVDELYAFFEKNIHLPMAQNDLQQYFPLTDKNSSLKTVAEVSVLIKQGKYLALAGDETVLSQLPKGNWIAGTIPYFMAEDGGLFSRDKIFVNCLPDYIKQAQIKVYDQKTISSVYQDGFDNGFSLAIIPAFCSTHNEFAIKAPCFPGFATRPLVGWISGIELDVVPKILPKVFDGNHGSLENAAVVLHVELPRNKYADLQIVNIFRQDQGDTIVFLEDGFSAGDVLINGQKTSFANYLLDHKVDLRLPLVADYYNALIYVSPKSINKKQNRVDLYASVFKNVEYKLAAPVDDYIAAFEQTIPKNLNEKILFSCNCVNNYLYGKLEGNKTGELVGPITFGEIAYQLLNQTLVYLTIEDIADYSI